MFSRWEVAFALGAFALPLAQAYGVYPQRQRFRGAGGRERRRALARRLAQAAGVTDPHLAGIAE